MPHFLSFSCRFSSIVSRLVASLCPYFDSYKYTLSFISYNKLYWEYITYRLYSCVLYAYPTRNSTVMDLFAFNTVRLMYSVYLLLLSIPKSYFFSVSFALYNYASVLFCGPRLRSFFFIQLLIRYNNCNYFFVHGAHDKYNILCICFFPVKLFPKLHRT